MMTRPTPRPQNSERQDNRGKRQPGVWGCCSSSRHSGAYDRGNEPSLTARCLEDERRPRTPNTYVISGMISSATMFATLIIGLIAGPVVSLNGSPTVSPVTAAA